MLSCPENLALKCFQDENYKVVEVSICVSVLFINNKELINKFVAKIFRTIK